MGDDWRRYPFELVPGEPQFCFPAAEGEHPSYESDTWFLAGELTGESTGRKFAFLTIFNKNRLGHKIVADFHTLALFDLDNGTYGTYTDYDVPPANMRPEAVNKLSTAVGSIDISYLGDAGTAEWRACRDEHQQLIPYTYELVLVGTDQADAAMELRLRVTPTRAPVPVGASAYDGKITCFGQADTYSYFQTGMTMAGTLRWGGIEEVGAVQDQVQKAAARRQPLDELSSPAITWHGQNFPSSHIERLVDADGADALASLNDQKVLFGLDERLPQSKEPAEVDDQAGRSMQIDHPQDSRVGSGKRSDSGHGDNLLNLFHRQGTDQAVDDERYEVLAHFRSLPKSARPL